MDIEEPPQQPWRVMIEFEGQATGWNASGFRRQFHFPSESESADLDQALGWARDAAYGYLPREAAMPRGRTVYRRNEREFLTIVHEKKRDSFFVTTVVQVDGELEMGYVDVNGNPL